jgi:hypothetical protein
VASKLFIALGFVLLLHFTECFANERTRRLKHPVILAATEALKVLVLNPYQLAWRGRIIRLTLCEKEQGP